MISQRAWAYIYVSGIGVNAAFAVAAIERGEAVLYWLVFVMLGLLDVVFAVDAHARAEADARRTRGPHRQSGGRS